MAARFLRAHQRLPLDPSDGRATFNDLIFQRLARDSWRLLERFCVDKEFAKLFVAATCPTIRVVRTVDVLPLTDEQDRAQACTKLLSLYGRPLVAKPTHGSGSVLFLRNSPDLPLLRSFIDDAKQSYYHRSRESQYKGLEPKIIIEQDIRANGQAPIDYKFFCARGTYIFCQIDVDRFQDHRRLLVDGDFRPIDVVYVYRRPNRRIERPGNFEAMVKAARDLSRCFRFVRVDLYSVRGAVYFGELTFAPEGGAGTLSNEAFGTAVLKRIQDSNRSSAMDEVG